LWGLLTATSVGVALPLQWESGSSRRPDYDDAQSRKSARLPIPRQDLLFNQFISPARPWRSVPATAASYLYRIASLPRGLRSLIFTVCALFATLVSVVRLWLQKRHRHREQMLASAIDARAKELLSNEEQLRSSHERLRAANDAVESANQAKAIFLANITHDLRTPLNSVLGYTQLLLRDANRETSSLSDLSDRSETRRKLQTILTSGEQMLEMINYLVERARVDPDPESDVPELQEILGYKGPTRKLLILDDDTVSRDFLRELLDVIGFEIIEASSTDNAIRLAAEQSFDGLIADLRIPGFDGQSICLQLKNHSNRSDLALIASSASSSESDRDYAIIQGFNEFVAKPVIGRTLLGVLGRHFKLEWVLREDNHPVRFTPLFANSEQAILQPIKEPVPSAEVLREILHAARLGDVIGLRKEIERIRESSDHFQLFCDRLNVVLTEFRMSAIEKIVHAALKQCVENMPDENSNGRR
jgi:CheY-like chemotaxis protein